MPRQNSRLKLQLARSLFRSPVSRAFGVFLVPFLGHLTARGEGSESSGVNGGVVLQSPVSIAQSLQPAREDVTSDTPANSPKASGNENVSSPVAAPLSVGILLNSLSQVSKPDWAAKFRPPIPSPIGGRVQTALVLGTFLSDSYLAVQAEDSQQCRNAGKEMLALAKMLGVQSELLDRGRSLGDAAQRKDWMLVRLELDAVTAELNAGLRAHQDDGMVRLITLGAWLRALEIVANIVNEDYSEAGAFLVRQPALALQLEASLEQLGDALKFAPILVQLHPRLAEIQFLLAGPLSKVPTPEEVKSLATILSTVLNDITATPQR